MKTYEKPRLIALSLSGNERLCGDCSGGITLWNDESMREILGSTLGTVIGDRDGVLEKSDFSNLFDSGTCTNTLEGYGIEGYCKFNGSGTTIAWS